MDKKSKILIRLFILLILLTIVATYYRSFVSKDYEVIPLVTETEEV